MSKKDYKQFAKLFEGQRPVKTDLESVDSFNIRKRQFEQILTGVINILASDNSRFDVQRFKMAVYS